MSGKIFINYRRGDDPGFTQALYMRLEDEFGTERLFMDVEGHIKPGDDFVEVLDAQVALSDVVLAVIGPRWADLMAARNGDADDFVAIELRSALNRQKRVIPVLVGGAAMPRVEQLATGIEMLARRNAVGLRPERFKADCQGLIAALRDQLEAAEQERAARTEAERQAAEATRREAEEQAVARAKAAEEQARRQAAAGLSPEEIRKAEELANWEFLKGRGDEAELRDHLARFPGGVTERFALSKLEQLVWSGLGGSPSAEALRQYLAEFPKGGNADAARTAIAKHEAAADKVRIERERRAAENDAWASVAAFTEKAPIEAFLKAWPDGQHARAAEARLKELRGPSRRLKYSTAIIPIAFLLGWLSISYATIKAPHWKNGYSVHGKPYEMQGVQTKADCINLCLKHPYCKAVTFSQGNGGICFSYLETRLVPASSTSEAAIVRPWWNLLFVF